MTTPITQISISDIVTEFKGETDGNGYSLGDYYRAGRWVNYKTHQDLPLDPSPRNSLSMGQLSNRTRRLELVWVNTGVYIPSGSVQDSYALNGLSAYGNCRKTIIVLHCGANSDGDAPLENWGTITATADGSPVSVFRDSYSFTLASDETAYNAWFRVPVGRAENVVITKTATVQGANDGANNPVAVIWILLDEVSVHHTNAVYTDTIDFKSSAIGYTFVAATGNFGSPGNLTGLDNNYDLGQWTRTGNLSGFDDAQRSASSAGAFGMSSVTYVPANTPVFNFNKPFLFTFSGGTNINLRSLALSRGWNGINRVVATNNGTISATSTGIAALTIDGSFPGGVNFVNSGLVAGHGGAGGAGGYYRVVDVGDSSYVDSPPGGAGGAGGTALQVSVPVTITNNGTIAGGGGGGGGTNATYNDPVGDSSGYWIDGSGGGGGAGVPPGAGGGSGGVAGTTTTGGAGGPGAGAGGGRGAAGGAGDGAGGAGGRAVNGNGNITWEATGTRLGAIV